VRTALSWDDRFKQLEAYKAANGDCNVPQKYALNPQLGNWVDKQRQLQKNGKLSDDRFERLENLGFVWTVRTALSWDDRFKQLEAYKASNGDCNVPKKYALNPQLGKWVDNQRGRKGSLSEDQIKRLNVLGFAWSLRSKKRKPKAPSESRTSKRRRGR
jgi:hypothetical protein